METVCFLSYFQRRLHSERFFFSKWRRDIFVGAPRGCCVVVGGVSGSRRIVFAILGGDVGKWAFIARRCFSNWNFVLFQ